MAFIPTPNTCKSALQFTYEGVSIVNTIWFTKSQNFDVNDLALMNQTLETWWATELKQDVTQDSVLDVITSYDMSSEFGPVHNRGVGLAGDAVSPVGSAQVVLTVSFKTNNRGRSGRGYNAWSPLLETQVDKNQIFAAIRNVVAAAYMTLNSYVDAVFPGCRHVVVSFYNAGVPRSEGLAQDVVAYASTTPFTRTQKRRRE